MKSRQIKTNAFKHSWLNFQGKTGAEYVRSMIAPQDEKMSKWLNERIRVGRFGTKQMTQLFEYALDNPTPEFYAYVLRKFSKLFGINRWNYNIQADEYEKYLRDTAYAAKEKLKVTHGHIERGMIQKDIDEYDKFMEEKQRYLRFCECFLHDEDWSVEQELEIGRARNETHSEVFRRDKIKHWYDMFQPISDHVYYPPPSAEELERKAKFDEWKETVPSAYVGALKEELYQEQLKEMLDEAEQRVEVSYDNKPKTAQYERKNK